uniref:Uncharacterized protein n=1 Tax=Rhizophora mucronata TaxID=61149 RepID=A0A2P2IX98_RHIMU
MKKLLTQRQKMERIILEATLLFSPWPNSTEHNCDNSKYEDIRRRCRKFGFDSCFEYAFDRQG